MTLARHGNVASCFKGTQLCLAGVWGECTDGVLSEEILADESKFSALALSQPEQCRNNPCDPFCHSYSEEPPGVIVANPGAAIFDWQAGASDAYPDGASRRAWREPCRSGADCQLNHGCSNVATTPACAHDKCTVGSRLSSTCDPCVAAICAQDPTCCEAGACAHDVCAAGVKLDVTCGQCTASVCQNRPSCCSDSWDATCVSLVGSLCGAQTCACGPGEVRGPNGSCYYLNTESTDWRAARDACRARGAGWDLVKIESRAENDFVASLILSDNGTWIGANDRPPAAENAFVWADGQPATFTSWSEGEPNNTDDEDCAEMYPSVGNWNDANCVGWRDYMCEREAGSTAREWTQRCVDRVASTCNASCGDGSGQCTAWTPGQTQTACATLPDLALGVPCGGGQVPVCNHGTAPAPAGARVAFFAASASQYPSCTPDLSRARGTCTVSSAIPAGECVTVTCPGLADGDELVVNPPGAGHVDECACGDNWSIYAASASCGAPSCGRASSEGFAKAARVLLVLDKSGAMATGDRWTIATQALASFFAGPELAGMQVALELFPLPSSAGGNGCGQATCDVAPCEAPLVPPGALSASPAPADTQEAALLAALGAQVPEGSAASAPALRGALAWAVAQNAPDSATAVVFVSQGEPSACVTGDSQATRAALTLDVERAYLDHGVRTYAVALQGAETASLHELAARGGTGEAFVLDSENGTSVSADLRSALVSITRRDLSCTLPLPSGGNVSTTAQVTLTSGATVTPLARRSRAQQCGSGWYFDDNASPSSIQLCPETCAAARALASARLEATFGCSTLLQPNPYRQTYDGVCPAGGKTQWSFLAYDSSTPGDSSVRFRARTADTEAALAAATFVDLATAQASPDTQRCQLSGPAPCPVDLFQLLGADAAWMRYLELEASVRPTTDQRSTATLNAWQITYSCPPAE